MEIIIKIDNNGYSVTGNGKTIYHKRVSRGRTKGNFTDEELLEVAGGSEDLAEAIEDGFYLFDLSNAIRDEMDLE